MPNQEKVFVVWLKGGEQKSIKANGFDTSEDRVIFANEENRPIASFPLAEVQGWSESSACVGQASTRTRS